MNLDFQNFYDQGEWVDLLRHQIHENTFPHALLITGDEGVGKKTLADLLAAAILCHDTVHRPCGHCVSCRLLDADAHPDLIVIQKGIPIAPTDSKTVIPVTDIIRLEDYCSVHPFEGKRKVIIIRDAENMNIQAQNKLLKTLEEPPENIFFLLTSRKKDQLLPTITSRCISVYLHPWQRKMIINVLKNNGIPDSRAESAADEAMGSIGRSLKLAADERYWQIRKEVYETFFHLKSRSDILAISNQWKERRNEAEVLFSLIESGILRLLEFRLQGNTQQLPEDIYKLYDPSWFYFAEKGDLFTFTALLDGMMLARKRLLSSMNFQIIVEQILLLLMEAKSK